MAINKTTEQFKARMYEAEKTRKVKYDYYKTIVTKNEFIVYNLIEKEEDDGEYRLTHGVKSYYIVKEEDGYKTYKIWHNFWKDDGLIIDLEDTHKTMTDAIKNLENERILEAI